MLSDPIAAIPAADAQPLEQPLAAVVERVCRRIPPVWDLHNYVAVNPFLGFSSQPIAEAARIVRDGLGAQLLPPVSFYRARWRAGAFTSADLALAAERASVHVAALTALLNGAAAAPLHAAEAVLTLAERHEQRYGGDWSRSATRQIGQWCAFTVAQPGAPWGRALSAGLYSTWREDALADRTLEIEGLRGWRAFVARLPEAGADALALLLAQHDIAASERESYLYRLLGGVYGWASLLRREAFQRGDGDLGPLADLLAIRACVDAAVAQLAPRRAPQPATPAPAMVAEDEQVRAVLQDALENGFTRQLVGKLRPPPAGPQATRPLAQAVFCIDVRSEPLRRHLEAQDAGIETRGFAGFFGVSLDWQAEGTSSARCPVLLSPNLSLRPQAPAASRAVGAVVKAVQSAPAAAFSFVELLGLAYGARLAADALAHCVTPRADEGAALFTLDPDGQGGGLDRAARMDLAATMIKNMSLRDTPLARLVLLCGHESQSENNPHAAGLDCGACGGHGGAINARVAAAVLNDPAVRADLHARGTPIPADTWFVPGVHNTAVDTVTLLDSDRLPASHRDDLAGLHGWLAAAGAATRAERAPALGEARWPAGRLARALGRRARDWSEVRPEWALARNAAFIAARRARTYGANLDGRVFLHEYDWRSDDAAAVLTLIMTAPMIVAAWINMQYFASTVDNRVFGAGSKALHNRVGAHGVVLGNGGDLCTGLAVQSVHAEHGSWFHEPLRLQVVIEAHQEQIDEVLAANVGVRDMVENGWVRLFALDPLGTCVAQRLAGGWALY